MVQLKLLWQRACQTILDKWGVPRGWVLPDRGLFLTGGGVYLDQIWTTATQLTTTDYNSRQLIKPGVIIGNVTQAVVVSCS